MDSEHDDDLASHTFGLLSIQIDNYENNYPQDLNSVYTKNRAMPRIPDMSVIQI